MFSKAALFVAGTVLLLGTASAGAQTQPVSILELQNTNGTLTDRDKIFSTFFCNEPDPANLCDSIFVTTLEALGSDRIGLQFSFDPVVLDNTPNSFDDATIFYSVQSTGTPIIAVGLSTDATVTGTGTFEVTEDVFVDETFGTQLGQARVTEDDNPPETLIELSAPSQTLFIQKDFNYAVGGNGEVAVTVITQDFVQAIPLPASAVGFLIGLGALGTLANRKR